MIKPLYKGTGDTKDHNDFRGITLLNCVDKLFTAIRKAR